MAVEVITWVFSHSRSKNGERLVMLAVADACNSPDGTGAWLSNAALMAKTNLSERAVQAAVKACELLGELKVERNAGRGGVNRFAVVMAEKVQNLHPADSAGVTDDYPAESAPFTETEEPQATDRKGAESAGGLDPRNPAESAPGTVSTKNSSTKSSVKTSTTKRIKKDEPEREDVTRICNFLAEWRVKLGCPRPTITEKWRTEARLMIDKDGRSLDEIKDIIRWSQRHHFWKANIQSIPKLREQYDTLRLQRDAQADRDKQPRSGDRGYKPWQPPQDQADYDKPFSGAAQ
jgi:hypothetical protein